MGGFEDIKVAGATIYGGAAYLDLALNEDTGSYSTALFVVNLIDHNLKGNRLRNTSASSDEHGK